MLRRAHEAAIGKPLQSFMTAGYLDTRVYALYDQIPALCYGPISQNIHGFDERVSLASIKRITTAWRCSSPNGVELKPHERG